MKALLVDINAKRRAALGDLLLNAGCEVEQVNRPEDISGEQGVKLADYEIVFVAICESLPAWKSSLREWHCRLLHKGLRRDAGEQIAAGFGAGFG